jgi:hypothetical protein
MKHKQAAQDGPDKSERHEFLHETAVYFPGTHELDRTDTTAKGCSKFIRADSVVGRHAHGQENRQGNESPAAGNGVNESR